MYEDLKTGHKIKWRVAEKQAPDCTMMTQK